MFNFSQILKDAYRVDASLVNSVVGRGERDRGIPRATMYQPDRQFLKLFIPHPKYRPHPEYRVFLFSMFILFSGIILSSCNNYTPLEERNPPTNFAWKQNEGLQSLNNIEHTPPAYFLNVENVTMKASKKKIRLTVTPSSVRNSSGESEKISISLFLTYNEEIDRLRYENGETTALAGTLLARQEITPSQPMSFEFSVHENNSIFVLIPTKNGEPEDNFTVYNHSSKIQALFISADSPNHLKVLNHGTFEKEKFHLFFVTSDSFNGKLGGLEGADNICQQTADAVRLKGKWFAFLADSKTLPSDRIKIEGPVFNLKGKRIAHNASDFWSWKLDSPLYFSETQEPIASALAWTGLSRGGNLVDSNCGNWFQKDTGFAGAFGQPANNSIDIPLSNWLGGEIAYCNSEKHLYCISQ